MKLLKLDILEAMKDGSIEITPFFNSVNVNSVDLHLSPFLAVYKNEVLDVSIQNETQEILIPREGIILYPGIVYLGSTLEKTTIKDFVPMFEGKSSIGRLGISVHITAGVGDIGFSGHWTLEITVVHPVRIYAGMPIGQLLFDMVLMDDDNSVERYGDISTSKYQEQEAKPVASRMYMNFPLKQSITDYVAKLSEQ